MRILIVDDRSDKLLTLEAMLEELRTEVVAVRCGRDALRQLLTSEFAVILMDINMPEMDGFETAALIRQSEKLKYTPIIFFTASDHEMHKVRSYSLGAVDYILTPVQPEVLRAKVGVFVELARKGKEVERQAAALQRKAIQLQKLASASVGVNAAPTLEGKLNAIVETARDIIGSHQAIVSVSFPTPRRRRRHEFVTWSLSDEYAEWRNGGPGPEAWRSLGLMGEAEPVVRLTCDELAQRLKVTERASSMPWLGVLAARLVDANGTQLGVLEVAHKTHGDFDAGDEAILVQLAQLGSVALQNWISEGAREANRIKDEFLGILSHELRTPLHAILGWTEHLQAEATEGSDLARGLDVIERNVRAQTALVEDLLDVSRITSGKLRLEKQEVSLRSLIAGVLDDGRPAAEAKKLTLAVHLGHDPASLRGDPNRLRQVFSNLLSNAMKFTPSGGKITVQMVVASTVAEVCVRDNGEGISPEFMPFVFERFRQGENTVSRAQAGLGLGLAIVRHIVELHGGQVDVESDGLGKGATFTVRIPLISPSEERA